MKKIYVETLTCDRRGLDANKTITYLSKNNYNIIKKPKDADIIIFFACAALNSITKKSLERIKKLQRYRAELIIAGCLPEIEKQRLAEIFHGRIISTKDIEKIDTLFPDVKIKFNTIDDANIVFKNINEKTIMGIIRNIIGTIKPIEKIYHDLKRNILQFIFGNNAILYKYLQDSSLYHVRISTGCLGKCSYCAIKKGIGSCVSKPLNECVKEFKNGLEKGYKKFIIDGDDIGAYGLDIDSNLPELLDNITKIEGDFKILVSNLHPKWVVEYISELEIILKRKKIENIQCSIQSGSSRILTLMNRYSDIEKIKHALDRLKDSNPNISLITDYILGFPTESEEDFQQTIEYIKSIKFDGGMIIPFSLNKGTEAEKIIPKVNQETIKKRFKVAKKYLKVSEYHVLYLPRFKSIIFFK